MKEGRTRQALRGMSIGSCVLRTQPQNHACAPSDPLAASRLGEVKSHSKALSATFQSGNSPNFGTRDAHRSPLGRILQSTGQPRLSLVFDCAAWDKRPGRRALRRSTQGADKAETGALDLRTFQDDPRDRWKRVPALSDSLSVARRVLHRPPRVRLTVPAAL